jgi:hypothetical protein
MKKRKKERGNATINPPPGSQLLLFGIIRRTASG